jgi:asparagine synthase (glutamine-hydrolysing)
MRAEVGFSEQHPFIHCDGTDIRPAEARHNTSWGVPGSPDSPVCSHLGLTLVGDITLHNRNELLRRVCGDFSNISSASDYRLVLEAYAKWGVSCPDFLLGEFAFAIWDSRQRHLFCCRDHIGARRFFYLLDKSGIAFASEIRQLLALARVPRKPHLQKLSAMAFPGGLKFFPDETFHLGVRSLRPASWMIVDRRGARQQTYWQPEIREGLVPRRSEEVFEALGELLGQAVNSRLDHNRTPAALLSGGLDSSSIVSLAGRHMAARNRSVIAVAGVVSDERRSLVGDEREYINEFRDFPGVDVEYVTPGKRGPFDFIEDPARFESGFLRTSRHYLYEELEAAAAARGADCLLCGEGGEYGPSSWGSPYYAELALSGRWLTLSREMAAASRVGEGCPVRQLAGELRNLASPHRGFHPVALLRNQFVRSAGVDVKMVRPWPRWPNQRYRQMTELRNWLGRDSIRDDPPHPLRLSYPLLDKRLVEFCISVPAKFKVRDGYSRYLIRRAMNGILPPRIQWRTSKGPFSPDYFIRYNNQVQKARDFVAGIGAEDPIRSVIDVETLSGLLRRPPVPNGDVAALSLVPTTIYLICFLRQFSEFRP